MIGSFGNYEILSELGRGGMGVVFMARETMLNRNVAMKVLPSHFAANPAFVDRFRREARAVARLNHPNVVTIFNIGEHEGHHYIVMEFVKGESMAELLRRESKLELGRALEIVRQVASALEEAHRAGIIHRDIKPHNIMIDEAGRAKVMDFGIARMTTEDGGGLTGTGETLGTPAYMSPEQCRGLDLDGRSDIYAAGVVLFEALTGRRPFQGDTPIASIEKVLFEPPPLLSGDLPGAPPAIVEIVSRCLAKNREERYPTAARLEHEIREFLYPGAATVPLEVLSGGSLSTAGLVETAGMAGGPPTGSVSGPATVIDQAPGALARAAWESRGSSRDAIQPEEIRRRVDDGSNGSNPADAPPPDRAKLARLGMGVVAASILLATGAYVARRPKPGPPVAVAAAVPQPSPPRSVLAWAEAPAPGSTVWDNRVHLAWSVGAGATVGGFRVGLNAADPMIECAETSHTFELREAGPQRIVVQPIVPGGETAAPLTLDFNYLPNKAPTVLASLARETIAVGSAAELNVEASDPENQPVRIEARADGADWARIQPGRQWVRGLAEGEHRFEVRAVDEPGRASESWSATATALPPAELIERAVKAYTGTRGKIDEPSAHELIESVAESGDPVGRLWLAWMLHWGRAGFKEDKAKAAEVAAAALPEALKLAEGDSPHAQFLAGAALELGLGAARDSAAGAPLLRKAAERGHTQAMTYLGWMELTGRMGKANESAAADWFQKAAELGDAQAMNNLGNLLARGSGVKKDEKKAAEWFQKGADLGSAANLNSLGAMYMDGRGVPKDQDKAIEMLRLAARLDNKTAQANLEKMNLTW